jgi:PAS domain S-box-containing protein
MPGKRFNQFFKRTLRWPAWLRYLLAIALTASCSAVCHALNSVLGQGVQFTAFYLVVVISVYLCGTGPAILAVLLSVITTDFRFMEPRGQFKFNEKIVVAESLFIVICASIVGTVHAMRRAQAVVEAEAAESGRRVLAAEKAEAAWRQSEALLRTVTNEARVGLVMVGQEHRYLFANAAYAEILGLPDADIVGRRVQDLLPDVYDQVQPRLDRAIAGERVTFELHLPASATRATDRYREVVCEPHQTPGSDPYVVVVVVDITARKQNERALRESADRLQLALAAGQLGDWTWDARTDLLSPSDRAAEIFGFPPGTSGPWTAMREFVYEADRERARFVADEALRSRSDYHIEYRIKRPSGELRWIATRGRGTYAADGTLLGMTGVVQDITDRKVAEAALRQAQVELQANAETLKHTVEERTAQLREKIGELEAFSYSVSHDMRQPLRAMQGYARILLQDYGERLEKEPRQFLERIIMGANRLDRLIQDVLTYSRIIRGEGELSSINLDKLVREVVETYPSLRSSHIEIVSTAVLVRGYEVALTQCIANLLGNALKFVSPETVPQVNVWAESSGEYVRLWVQDNGIGIAKRDQARIFDIFSRVHGNDRYEGTGIGLSIVKKAVEKMGGRVGVESEIGKGSRFWIELQRAPEVS